MLTRLLEKVDGVTARPATEELRPALEAALSAVHDHEVDVIGLERRRSRVPLQLRAGGAGRHPATTGRDLALVFKDLGWETLDADGAAGEAPLPLRAAARDRASTGTCSPGPGLGTAAYHGSTVDEARGRFWLFVERVAGVELYQVGDVARWEEAARWLAATHAVLAGDPERSAAAAHLSAPRRGLTTDGGSSEPSSSLGRLSGPLRNGIDWSRWPRATTPSSTACWRCLAE